MLLKLTRSKLESLVGDLVEKTMGPVEKALADADLSKADVNEIIMVGGMTRMPMVLKKVEDYFGKKPHVGINPDEVVALGAAVQAGVLQGDVKDVLLLDVTPLTLGIETMGAVATPLIERNTTIPASKSQVFSTAADNQTSVEIHVVQGERPMAPDNKSLGKFMLSGIPPSPRGVPQVEVTFDLDANGILNVKAKDKATGKEQSITITASTGLSKDEVERMKQEAKQHEAEDVKKKELIEVRNLAEQTYYTAEKALKDAGDKVPADTKKTVEAKMENLKKVKDGDDKDVIKKAAEALSAEMQKIGQAAYQKQTPPEGQAGQTPPNDQNKEEPKKESETVEGEYEEVKKDDKK